MKYLINSCLVIAFLFAYGCSQSASKTTFGSTGAVIEFENTEHDFGTIPYKGDGTVEFKFRSKGEEPLVLKNVRTSCGCTISEYPKDPIPKGEKGAIKVSYNTKITGGFSKSISVYSNASEAPIVLVVKGKVEEEEEQAETNMSAAPALQ